MIPDEDPRLKNITKLLVPAKSATIWLAKTIHCSTSSNKNIPPRKDKSGKVTLDRLSALVSYCETHLLTPEVVKMKLKAVENGKATIHWARLCVLQRPPRWGRPKGADPLHAIPPKKLTEEELKLVVPEGFKK